jgi:hypothetical protein
VGDGRNRRRVLKGLRRALFFFALMGILELLRRRNQGVWEVGLHSLPGVTRLVTWAMVDVIAGVLDNTPY